MSSTLRLSEITDLDPSTCPVATTFHNTGYSFSVKQTTRDALQIANKGQKPSAMTNMGENTKLWDGFMWLSLNYGQ